MLSVIEVDTLVTRDGDQVKQHIHGSIRIGQPPDPSP